jgi:hypothetical protein
MGERVVVKDGLCSNCRYFDLTSHTHIWMIDLHKHYDSDHRRMFYHRLWGEHRRSELHIDSVGRHPIVQHRVSTGLRQ